MKKQTVLILGAGGIIGQHLLITCPDWVEGIFTRRSSGTAPWTRFDAEKDDVDSFLDSLRPDVIINLAGENRVDMVESEPDKYHKVNVRLPEILAAWSARNGCYFMQSSSQGVFSGNNPTYSPEDTPDPITHYGKQKALSEKTALSIENSEVARFTFVLGIRPFQDTGRRNPLEDMIEKKQQLQVDDRFFSPLFAEDCAEIIWERVRNRNSSRERIVHIGCPVRCSRFSIASDVKRLLSDHIAPAIQPVSHDYFSGLAARPGDTTWDAERCLYNSSYEEGLARSCAGWSKLAIASA
ncbi:MAG TPA: sugar nucleotide-binding protein [Gallionella sp.]|nr:sugar nucleotide-binding protein [Gallionella sp.]